MKSIILLGAVVGAVVGAVSDASKCQADESTMLQVQHVMRKSKTKTDDHFGADEHLGLMPNENQFPRTWDAGEAPFGIEVVVDPPQKVASVTVSSDWWSKRPKDLAVFVMDGDRATLVAEYEYPTTLDICGPNGDEECSYPDRPVSQVTIPFDSDIVASAIRVEVLTPRNEAGQPNGQVIIEGVTVTALVKGGQDGSCPAGFERVSIAKCPQLDGMTLADGTVLSNSRHRVDCAVHFVNGAGCFVNRHNNVYSTSENCPAAQGTGHDHWAVCEELF